MSYDAMHTAITPIGGELREVNQREEVVREEKVARMAEKSETSVQSESREFKTD